MGDIISMKSVARQFLEMAAIFGVFVQNLICTAASVPKFNNFSESRLRVIFSLSIHVIVIRAVGCELEKTFLGL